MTTPKRGPLLTLPPELHLQLLHHLPQPALSSLSLTSRYFHSLLTPRLYHSPQLETFSSFVLFARTLTSNPHHIARHIRRLHYVHSEPFDARVALNAVRVPGMMDQVKKGVRRRWLTAVESVVVVVPTELRQSGWWEKEWRAVRDGEGLEGEGVKKRVKVAIGSVWREKGVVRFVVAPSDGLGWVPKEGSRGEWVKAGGGKED